MLDFKAKMHQILGPTSKGMGGGRVGEGEGNEGEGNIGKGKGGRGREVGEGKG